MKHVHRPGAQTGDALGDFLLELDVGLDLSTDRAADVSCGILVDADTEDLVTLKHGVFHLDVQKLALLHALDDAVCRGAGGLRKIQRHQFAALQFHPHEGLEG